ncbi:MAG: M48 family metalloprotease [Deltaproteobacteria bacterium]|jgi:Zn-dependent protease with chaperone function|nr:M48 family metalloprotease [Deltaproteobacteria bacterium]
MTRGSSDFFGQQDKNRRWSLFFAAFFALNYLVLFSAVFFAVRIIAISQSRFGRPSPHYLNLAGLIVALTIAAFLFVISVLKFLSIRSNGSTYVPSLLKAVPLGDEGISKGPGGRAQELIVRNVVGELAVAASIEEPDVYILPGEQSINAMASGLDPDDSSIVITGGALDRLDRDELLALMAHEFSHIANSDTRHFTLMAGWLHGFFWLSSESYKLMLLPGMTVLGLFLSSIGFFGSIFGKISQAAFSRRRESLADSQASQLTRNPGALARVLRKIGGLPPPRRRRSPLFLPELSHFFLAEPRHRRRGILFGLLDSHPPLPQRIWDLDPLWDGYYWDFEENPVHFLDDPAPLSLWPSQATTAKSRSIMLPML